MTSAEGERLATTVGVGLFTTCYGRDDPRAVGKAIVLILYACIATPITTAVLSPSGAARHDRGMPVRFV